MAKNKVFIPFEQRVGLVDQKPISDDFPETAIVGLIYILEDIIERNYVVGGWDSNAKWRVLLNELYRIVRITTPNENWVSNMDEAKWLLSKASWVKVYSFCERIYSKLLEGIYNEQEDEWHVSLNDVQKYFSDEINILLLEENLDYKFENGEFNRNGRLQTQKSISKMGAVLSNTNLTPVRQHYNKALRFFNNRENPDYENCIKEAICALESCLELSTGQNASKEFVKSLKRLEGNGNNQIPSPIVESIVKLFAYRGGGQGVAHSALNGARVTEFEAELVLNLVASYITYFVDLFPINQDDIPF